MTMPGHTDMESCQSNASAATWSRSLSSLGDWCLAQGHLGSAVAPLQLPGTFWLTAQVRTDWAATCFDDYWFGTDCTRLKTLFYRRVPLLVPFPFACLSTSTDKVLNLLQNMSNMRSGEENEHSTYSTARMNMYSRSICQPKLCGYSFCDNGKCYDLCWLQWMQHWPISKGWRSPEHSKTAFSSSHHVQ